MTLNIPLIMTPFPQIVIQNGRKNALRKKRETGWWHGVKNLWLWWHLTIFLTTATDPSHSLRMTFNVSLTMTPYTIRSHSALLADSWQLTANGFQLIAFILLPLSSP